MVYAIEYFKQNDETMTFYKLPVTFTVLHAKYNSINKFEHVVKCLRNTEGIRMIRVETNETLTGVDYFEYSSVLMKAYYECRVSNHESGVYKVQLKQYKTNPYF